MAIAYAALQNVFVGSFLIVLSILSTIQRVLSDRAVSRVSKTTGQNYQIIIIVGLIWTVVTTVTTDVCVVSGQPFLIVLASCVSTGLAFGAAFNNAAAPRFARTQLTVMILPFIAVVACLPAPHMLWILGVAPLWVCGTFLVVERSYCAKSELIHAQQRATFLALNDQLTGLPNRAQILATLHRCCDGPQATKHQTSYVLFLDLDGFKEVNDRYGHSTGDELLCAVAGRLNTSVRANDVVGRFGGDEFVVILEIASTQQVREIADRMVASLEEPFNLASASGVHVGVSIGGACLSIGNASTVLEEADALLYAAKRAGKGIVRLSPPPSGEWDVRADSSALLHFS
ncbi:MAG: diguanylate cyclase domain-containing protein [Janthinobacterium lividum]